MDLSELVDVESGGVQCGHAVRGGTKDVSTVGDYDGSPYARCCGVSVNGIDLYVLALRVNCSGLGTRRKEWKAETSYFTRGRRERICLEIL